MPRKATKPRVVQVFEVAAEIVKSDGRPLTEWDSVYYAFGDSDALFFCRCGDPLAAMKRGKSGPGGNSYWLYCHHCGVKVHPHKHLRKSPTEDIDKVIDGFLRLTAKRRGERGNRPSRLARKAHQAGKYATS